MAGGRVKLEVKPIAILGPESELAAQAAHAANEQGRFWEFHDILYANQAGRNQGAFSLTNLKRMAAALNLDAGAFAAAMDSYRFESTVRAETARAAEAGVGSTPTVLVNGTPVEPTLEAAVAAVERELAALP